MFYYNKKSRQKIVHTAQCHYCKNGDVGVFPTLKDAYAAGYRLCKVCNPAFRQFRAEQHKIQKYCAENGLICLIDRSAIMVITPLSQWKIISNDSGRYLELYHRNTYGRNTDSLIKGYHSQDVSYRSIMEHLQYIYSHDAYRIYHPYYAPPRPKPAPRKGTKRYAKEQTRRKRAEHRIQTKHVLALINQILNERQSVCEYEAV